MPITDKTTLKTYFEDGDVPTESQFEDLIDTLGGTTQGTGTRTYNIRAINEGTTTGDARGESSVDLQTVRSASTQVASGSYSQILGGNGNIASGQYSFVGNGLLNKATSTYSVVLSGNLNEATGGPSNVFSGYLNKASGFQTTIVTGLYGEASGQYSLILCGQYNETSGQYSVILGGQRNEASATYSSCRGYYSLANKYGQSAVSSGRFASAGDAQASCLVARRQTTNDTATELFLDGSSQRMTIATGSTWGFTASIVARRSGADDESGFFKIEGCIDNNSGTVALVGTNTSTTIAQDNSWAVSAEADNTNKALVIKVTGESGKTINWVAKIDLVEVIA